jgi:hypothetical protein
MPKGATEEQALEKARALSELAQRKGVTRAAAPAAAEPPKGKTVAEWFESWLDERERRGLASVRTDRGRWSKWIEPQIGALHMTAVTTEDLERFVQHLDEGQALLEDGQERLGARQQGLRRRGPEQDPRAPRAAGQPSEGHAAPRRG